MTAGAVRAVVLVICAGGIAGMIISSIADSDGAAITFGLATAVAVLCLMVATAVARSTTARSTAGRGTTAGADDGDGPAQAEALGQEVERLIDDLVRAGADEEQARALARAAVRLGRLSS